MAEGMVAAPRCAACGSPSARVELVAPGQLPAEWERWGEEDRADFAQFRDPRMWHLLFEGVAAGNGEGDAISADEAEQIWAAFRQPYTYARVHTAGFHDDAGFCGQCDTAYCYQDWDVSPGGVGVCPRRHSKSLDLW